MENLEELAANAWPAPVVQTVDGWRLRFGWGVTRRANSVLTTARGARLPLPDKVALAEEFYARRLRPAMFAVSEVSSPAGVDAFLADRGYNRDTVVAVQIADARDVAETDAPPVAEVTIGESLTDEWVHDWWVFAERRDKSSTDDPEVVARVILESTGPRTAYVESRLAGRVAAVGRVTVERGWAGIFAVATDPDLRRKGFARQGLVEMARWALSAGANAMYVQVEEENRAALDLYENCGFGTAYRYWYRRRGDAGESDEASR
ncbi:MAG: hypothetical protein JJLCMIEE_02277 [Acidimicrobiales bacterium]|nr:MAG: GNAT family N-acetyltransferase [Actinomycetota bacterium]MBV6509209.1 hypothetical protein [Acidimicrobiales bacterium]RIK08450.1 MAG: hypothetical protein DCC48_00415 [Acidobacteriota bacterium]